MEFLLQVGSSRQVHGIDLTLLDLVGQAITIKLDDREINLLQGLRILIASPVVQGTGSYLKLVSVKEHGAVFDLRLKRAEKKRRNLAKKMAINRITKKISKRT